MAPNRYYSSNAVETTLTAGISNSAITIAVASATGYPASVPFTVHVDLGTSSEEIMTVTNVSGTNFDVTRGVDGSSALSHSLGATVIHGVSARDFSEPQTHLGSSAGVHGLAGTVVGTTDAQTLTNKTLTQPIITLPRVRVTGPDISVADNTLTGVPFNVAVTEDPGSWWDIGTPEDLVLPYNGFYGGFALVNWQKAGDTDGVMELHIVKSSGEEVTGSIVPGFSSTPFSQYNLNCSFYREFAAGDVLRMKLKQNQGSALNAALLQMSVICLTRN